MSLIFTLLCIYNRQISLLFTLYWLDFSWIPFTLINTIQHVNFSIIRVRRSSSERETRVGVQRQRGRHERQRSVSQRRRRSSRRRLRHVCARATLPQRTRLTRRTRHVAARAAWPLLATRRAAQHCAALRRLRCFTLYRPAMHAQHADEPQRSPAALVWRTTSWVLNYNSYGFKIQLYSKMTCMDLSCIHRSVT